MTNISFNKFYRQFNVLSLILIAVSLVLLIFKGLNYGVDFKGGTLIELRTDLNSANIKKIRDSFSQLNLGDVSVKNFGNDTDFIIKFEKQNSNDPKFIENIKSKLSSSVGSVDFRRVENVGPKVSSELLKSGVIAITLSLAAASDKVIAITPDLRSSELTLGPTFSTLLKSTEPTELDNLDLIFSINFGSLEFCFSNLIIKSVSLPKFLTDTSPRFNWLKLSLIFLIFAEFKSVLNSINVPPLKSTP